MTGKTFSAGFQVAVDQVMLNTIKEVAEVVKNASIEDYKSKRKATGDSQIIAGFGIKAGKGKYNAIVFTGGDGSSAPYAIYVDQDHTIANQYGNSGKIFKGYEFMLAGLEAAKEQIEPILNRNMMKLNV